MKARIIATGEIVDIIRNSAFDKDVFYDSNGQKYNREELSFDVKEKSFPKDDPDYWTRLEHTYAGMVMQGMLSNEYTHKLYLDNKNYLNGLLNDSITMAHALVEKLKGKEERK